jgi:hypothetical protein
MSMSRLSRLICCHRDREGEILPLYNHRIVLKEVAL